MNELKNLMSQAWQNRADLKIQWQAEKTDCYRIFHGTNEGLPGTTLDRYGPLLILQTFHQPLNEEELAQVCEFANEAFPGLHLTYNDRSKNNSRIQNAPDELHEQDTLPMEANELGIKYRVQ